MFETKLRPIFEKAFVTPGVKILQDKATPNTITLIALAIGLISSFFVSVDFRIIAIILLLLSGYFDVLDGAIARVQENGTTPIGTMLDIISDRFVESFIIIAFYIRQPELGIIPLLMLLSMIICLSSFLLVGIFSKQEGIKGFFYSSGLMERGESFIFFIIMILWPASSFILGIVFTILVLWTAFYRIYQFNKEYNSSL